MSLFGGPEEHAKNPPETWQIFKGRERSWSLRTLSGMELGRYIRRRDADEAKVSGWLRNHYDDEGRWYRGEPTRNPWRPWAEVKAELDHRFAPRSE